MKGCILRPRNPWRCGEKSMEVLQWCKMQMVCLLILCYVGIIHIREGRQLNRMTAKSNCNSIFDALFIVAEMAVLFDGITACSVNFLECVPKVVNLLLHLGMFLLYELFVVLLFWYWIYMTVGIPKNKLRKCVYILPSVIFGCLTILFLPQLSFLEGKYTNYSMGWSVYACFTCITVYFLMSIGVIIAKHRYIPVRKKSSLTTCLMFVVVILSLQVFFPELLISCIAATMIVICIFLSMENPTIHSLEHYENEMVMGFATLVENKDDNTGGHIRRSSAYANLIAKNLRKNGKYKNIITGAVLEKSFRPTEKFPAARIERKDMQYLYNDGELYNFMDVETFDQIALNADVIGDSLKFVKENEMCKINSHNGNVFAVEPPLFVELLVTECEPGVKGDTATSASKNAKCETGLEVKVPLFIENGEHIIVSTIDGKYSSRA